MARTIYFGPYVIDVDEYAEKFGDKDLEQLLDEAMNAVDKIEEWIEEDGEDG